MLIGVPNSCERHRGSCATAALRSLAWLRHSRRDVGRHLARTGLPHQPRPRHRAGCRGHDLTLAPAESWIFSIACAANRPEAARADAGCDVEATMEPAAAPLVPAEQAAESLFAVIVAAGLGSVGVADPAAAWGD
jgi:hypothetical protein